MFNKQLIKFQIMNRLTYKKTKTTIILTFLFVLGVGFWGSIILTSCDDTNTSSSVKSTSYDGTYVWNVSNSSCEITVYGSSWHSRESFYGNYNYNKGTLRDNKLYMDGVSEVGYISGNSLYYCNHRLIKE